MGPQFAQAQLAESQDKVFGDLPALGQDLSQPLLGRFGQAKVADGGGVLKRDSAALSDGVVTLGRSCDLVLPGV